MMIANLIAGLINNNRVFKINYQQLNFCWLAVN